MSPRKNKVYITCAVTGGATLPSQTPYLPITPKQIADEAIKAHEAGAAIVHIHVRDPKDGRPTSDINVWREVITRIHKKCDVIINTTTGGALGMTPEERVKVVKVFKPEMASLNMGSLSSTRFVLLDKIQKFKYAWEREYLERTKHLIFANTIADIEYFVKTMYECGTLPELECYDTSHLYNAEVLLNRGILKAPLCIQFVLGYSGGMRASAENLIYMKNIADKLFGEDNYTWSVIGIGRHEFPLGILAAYLGGNIRVGFEDNIYLKKGVLAKSNAELVEKMRRLLDELDIDIMDSDEVRKMLNLKGKENVCINSEGN